MKRFALSMIVLSTLLLTLTQRVSTEEGEKTTNRFFSAILKKDFQKAEKMMDRPIGDTTDFTS